MRVSDRASRQGAVAVAAPTVVIRDGIPRDSFAITRNLTAAADDDRIRDWFERRGYTPIGPPELLPGGVPVWPMRR